MRCKACNAVLSQYEIIWRADIEMFEDLCRKCRTSVGHAEDMSIAYTDDLFESENMEPDNDEEYF